MIKALLIWQATLRFKRRENEVAPGNQTSVANHLKPLLYTNITLLFTQVIYIFANRNHSVSHLICFDFSNDFIFLNLISNSYFEKDNLKSKRNFSTFLFIIIFMQMTYLSPNEYLPLWQSPGMVVFWQFLFLHLQNIIKKSTHFLFSDKFTGLLRGAHPYNLQEIRIYKLWELGGNA